MNAVAEYRVPAEDFALGRATLPGMVIELERLVGDGETAVQFFWVDDGSQAEFERSLRENTPFTDVELVDAVDGRSLYRARSGTEDSLVRALVDHDVSVLSAEGNDEEWWFSLSFPDRTALSAFQTACVDEVGIGLELAGVYNPVDASAAFRSELTDRQRETLLQAYREGYYDIPRRITLVGLADLLEVSDQAVSERMRRAQAKLVRSHLLDDLETDASATE